MLALRGASRRLWAEGGTNSLQITARSVASVAGGGEGAAAAAPAVARRWGRRRWLLLLPSAAGGYWLSTDADAAAAARAAAALPARAGRAAWAAAATVADYRWAAACAPLGSPAAAAALRGAHERGARRLLDLAFANGGVYIKLAQHVGMLDHLLPPEYVTLMRAHALDRCPVTPPAGVWATVAEELGAPPEALFDGFDPLPVASASLAQVHVAVERGTGRRLAVKVQHRALRHTAAADLLLIAGLVRAARAVTGADFTWLSDEAAENLPRELDFRREAANAARCAARLAAPASGVRGRVVVPEVLPALSSRRVLTMEFVDGAKVTDVPALRALGARPAAVARVVAQAFGEMVFRDGDVHADPHAANLMVRAAPPGAAARAAAPARRAAAALLRLLGVGAPTWQVVLLDHGLYRRLDDDFRLRYAALWRALVFGDAAGIAAAAAGMGAGDAVPLFAGVLTQRPWAEVAGGGKGRLLLGGARAPGRLRLRGTEEERAEVQRYAVELAGEISDLLARVPRPLLLLLKTNDCLRALDRELGAGVSSLEVTARESSRALAEARAAAAGGGGRARAAAERLALEARLVALRAVAWLGGG